MKRYDLIIVGAGPSGLSAAVEAAKRGLKVVVFDENEKLLDNQDLAFLLKASFRTLQRYRAKGVLPYFTIGRKTYYRASDIRAFVREYADSQTYKQFEKANQLANQP